MDLNGNKSTDFFEHSMADGAFTFLLLFCNFIFFFSFIDVINVLTTSLAKYNTKAH